MVHATTLRWNLVAKNRLIFNSNLRLFTSSRYSLPNRWMFNAVDCLCLTWSFACTSLMFPISGEESPKAVNPGWMYPHGTIVMPNGLALFILGLSPSIQALLATWALHSTFVPPWSSSPLLTAGTSSISYVLITNSPNSFLSCVITTVIKTITPTPSFLSLFLKIFLIFKLLIRGMLCPDLT